METEKTDISTESLSNLILEELKVLAAEGRKLTSKALAARLSSRREFTAVMDAASGKTTDAQPVSELNALKDRVEQSRAQREKLLKQLSDLEETAAQSERTYRRALQIVADLVHSDRNPTLNTAIADLKGGLKEGAAVSDLEAAMTQIKNLAIHDEPLKGADRIGFFEKFRKRTPPEPAQTVALERLKEAYLDIIGELRLNLDQDSFKRLAEMENRIRQAMQVDDFSAARKEMISLIQDYISRVSGEREEAAEFIREIGQRLMEVETHILDTLPHAQQTHQANKEFSSLLERKIGELRQRVDFSKTLAELKQTVVSSLSSVQKAIEDKREKDESRIAEVDQKMKRLQQDIDRMKREITSEKDRADQLEREVLVDPLTGVYNRRAYEKRIREELQRYLRHNRPFSVLLLDVDHFKSINDQYGHAVGDLCLKEIINRVRPLLRKSDFLARFGGEEFILLLPETLQAGAAEAAEKLRACIEKTDFLHRGNPVAITISIGVTQVMSTDRQSDMLFSRVDKALYRAKASGRNCVIET